MQSSDLVIIPKPYIAFSQFVTDFLKLPHCKDWNKKGNIWNEIPWKKSHSAFKKCKLKKDKQTKSTSKQIQTSLPFMAIKNEQSYSCQNYALVDIDINLSLLISQNEQVSNNQELFKCEETFEYFDPNTAPFFQYGIAYQYFPKQGRVQVIQDELDKSKLTKRSESSRIRKEPSKRQKCKEQFSEKQILIKTQQKCHSEALIQKKCQYLDDPFIIIKAPERRGQFLQSVLKNQHLRRQQSRKRKMIKKEFRPRSGTPSVHSYQNQNSHQIQIQEDSQDDQKSANDYGSDELPVIEFDLFKHFNASVSEVKTENGIANLPVYEVKDDSQIFMRARQYQNNSDVLKQYNFMPSEISGEKSPKIQDQCSQFNIQVEGKQQYISLV